MGLRLWREDFIEQQFVFVDHFFVDRIMLPLSIFFAIYEVAIAEDFKVVRCQILAKMECLVDFTNAVRAHGEHAENF